MARMITDTEAVRTAYDNEDSESALAALPGLADELDDLRRDLANAQDGLRAVVRILEAINFGRTPNETAYEVGRALGTAKIGLIHSGDRDSKLTA